MLGACQGLFNQLNHISGSMRTWQRREATSWKCNVCFSADNETIGRKGLALPLFSHLFAGAGAEAGGPGWWKSWWRKALTGGSAAKAGETSGRDREGQVFGKSTEMGEMWGGNTLERDERQRGRKNSKGVEREEKAS